MTTMIIVNILRKINFKTICGLFAGLSIAFGTFMWKQNQKLSQSLEMAQNTIESYEDIVNGTTEENKTLKLTVEQFKNSNDSIIKQLNSTIKEDKVKITNVNVAATQTQSIDVTAGREVEGESIIVNTPSKTYNDSIKFNDLTTVYYIISKDSVNIALDIKNTQYLYTYRHKEWKNKKSFFKRLITLDFKKVYKYDYKIKNTNDLIDMSDVRVVELNN